jgi:xanthine dehydrogenase YagR molybdenum-binding subunit
MIGKGIDRIEGPLKVTGRAPYEYDEWNSGQPLYGFIVGASIGHGSITRIDTARAEQARGVRRVLTYRDIAGQHLPDKGGFDRYSLAYPVMNGPEVHN